jgi:hypothetical protein
MLCVPLVLLMEKVMRLKAVSTAKPGKVSMVIGLKEASASKG